MFVGMGANGAGGYNLTDSLRFRRSASARLTRTFASTGTNNKIQTFSAWVKRGNLSSSSTYRLMGGYDGSSTNSTEINFVNDQLRIEFGGSASNSLVTTSKYRDPSAWYHIVVAIDTTQATSTNRVKLYVNDSQITAFDTANYPAQNAVSQLTSANANNSVGAGWGGFDYFDGYLTEVNFVDGQVLTPSDFGEYNEDTGVWKPKKYTGTYGTNGFYLKGRGTDNSGNGNNWTENNFNTSNSALTTYDIMTDVPTLTDEDTGNFCVLSDLNRTSGMVVSEGNLKCTTTGGAGSMTSTMATGSSGKYYAEFKITSAADSTLLGIVPATYSVSGGNFWTYTGGTGGLAYYYTGILIKPSGNTSYGASYTTNDVIGIAIDMDAGDVTFYKNGVSQGVAQTGLSGNYYFALGDGSSGSNTGYWANFGQRPFAYTPPTGFKKLNTYNLPDSTIKDGSQYFGVNTWSGDSTSPRVIVNQAQFKPDLVWVKGRNGIINHILIDSVRGTQKNLISNSTSAEVTSPVNGSVSAFNSNGFSVITGTSDTVEVNYTGYNYVGWQWKAGGTGVSNTAGTITSTVSANPTAGFSVVTYTGTGANATVGHGLGVAPSMVIVKGRGNAYNWAVWHNTFNVSEYIYLSTTNAKLTYSNIWYQLPTATTFGVSTDLVMNQSTIPYVAYCFAEVEGFSKFGSYTGNGSADGTFVYTGFTPAFVMVKRTNSSLWGWVIIDNKRSTPSGNNLIDKSLLANASDAEYAPGSGWVADFLSNGFKFRMSANHSSANGNGDPYIYMAFAENPFKNSLAR